MTDELELIYMKTNKPWKFSKEEYETMIRYGVTDEDIRQAWRDACEWGHVRALRRFMTEIRRKT